MNIEQKRVDQLVAHPSESLNVEIKNWISPGDKTGEAKIVRAALALRNRNGGYLIIGFHDKTLLPELNNRPDDLRGLFHPDRIQGLVSHYASVPFETGVAFAQRDGHEYPVIVIPEGVRSPVAAKANLIDGSGKNLIRLGDVYFRTLSANGTASTTAARPQDWPDIVEICFENREADFGRFLRRQLAGRDMATFLGALQQLGVPGSALSAPPQPATLSLRDRSIALLDAGEQRFKLALATRKPSPEEKAVAEVGSWSVGLVVDPPRASALPDKVFLSTIASSNPQYTGWPVWLDSSGFVDETARPKVTDKTWEALIVSLASRSKSIDFLRFDPKGEFYLWRNLQDDVSDRISPLSVLDPIIAVLRVAEAIAVGLSLAKALGWDPERTRLGFAFRWTKLNGRELVGWANPENYFSAHGTAHDDVVTTYVELPLETPVAAISPGVEQAVQDLFVLFGGYRMPSNVIEHWVQRLIERRLA
jgi:hypothetical protein